MCRKNRFFQSFFIAVAFSFGLLAVGKARPAEQPRTPQASARAFVFSAEQKAHRFFPYFQRWAKQDAEEPPTPDAVLCIGSSSIVMWKTIHHDLAPLKIIHRGFGGSTMRDVLMFKEFFRRYGARRILIYEGDNDLAGSTTPEQFVRQCKAFVEYIRGSTPDAKFWFLTPKPSPKRWEYWPKFQKAIALLKSWAETDPAVQVIDVASAMLDCDGKVREDIFRSDCLHMNAKGYAIWTRLVRAALLEPQATSLPPDESSR